MKRSINRYLLTLALIISFDYGYANDIKVSNVSLVNQNTTSNYWSVKFDISWENSWNISGLSNNHDAAWVFVKYRVGQGDWQSAFLNNIGSSVTGSSTPTLSFENGLLNPALAYNANSNPVMGVFIYRTNTTLASGNNTATSVRLIWNYGNQSPAVNDDDVVDVRVFAIEMVHIPTGEFAVGSGASADNEFTITTISTSNATQSPSGSGSLGGNSGGYPTGETAPASSNFPNGYSAFYAMKYEVTQQQYADFLNTLTRTQQAIRFSSTIVGNFFYSSAGRTTPSNRNGLRLISDPGGSLPRYFGCDLNNNSTPDESTDGGGIACNFLSWADISAYLDWACLRPITELEYEKIARGDKATALNEFTWGNTNLIQSTGLSSDGSSAETASPNTANCNNGSLSGPVRVGSFSKGAYTREKSGASYFGCMELSGNVEELVICIANSTGRSFTGDLGNGVLTTNGFSDVNSWPISNGSGAGTRGGSWNSSISLLQTSNRANSLSYTNTRNALIGGRGGR
jgi:formylglycine-generating enzyme required for sulfatase activity